MARYIDADALIKKVFPYDVVDKKCYTINAKTIYEAIQEAPTADVAPKSEFAREIIDIIEQRRSLEEDASIGHYVDFWIGVYRGIDLAYRDIKEIIEQKYTEGKT